MWKQKNWVRPLNHPVWQPEPQNPSSSSFLHRSQPPWKSHQHCCIAQNRQRGFEKATGSEGVASLANPSPFSHTFLHKLLTDFFTKTSIRATPTILLEECLRPQVHLNFFFTRNLCNEVGLKQNGHGHRPPWPRQLASRGGAPWPQSSLSFKATWRTLIR